MKINKTDGVRDLVAEALGRIEPPYPEDVTDRVCRAIESDPELRRRYDLLGEELGAAWKVNNAIGWYVPELTGLKSRGDSRRSTSGLMTRYRVLE